MFCEFTYENGEAKPVAIIDYKHTGQILSDKWPAIQCQIWMANNCGIPFYFVIYFLDEEYATKCYFVVPGNSLAKKQFAFWKLSEKGAWLGLKDYSKFQHALRKKIWNGDEVIDDKNLITVGFAPGMKLKDLPNKVDNYPLPEIKL
jgi:hypothetical protein